MSSKPKSFKEIWKNSLAIYARVLLRLLPIFIFLAVIGMLQHKGIKFFEQDHALLLRVVVIAVFIVVALLRVWVYGITVLQVNAIRNNQLQSFATSGLFTFKKYLPFLFGIILTALIITAGTMLLIIPGIFCGLVLAFVKYRILLEKEGVFLAIKNCFKLVWGHWWRTFLVFSPFYLLVIIFLILQLYARLHSLAWVENLQLYLYIPLVTILLRPLIEALFINQYYDLKNRAELQVSE